MNERQPRQWVVDLSAAVRPHLAYAFGLSAIVGFFARMIDGAQFLILASMIIQFYFAERAALKQAPKSPCPDVQPMPHRERPSVPESEPVVTVGVKRWW